MLAANLITASKSIKKDENPSKPFKGMKLPPNPSNATKNKRTRQIRIPKMHLTREIRRARCRLSESQGPKTPNKIKRWVWARWGHYPSSTRIKDAGIAIRHSREGILFYTAGSRNGLEGVDSGVTNKFAKAPSGAKYREKGRAASKTGSGPSANPSWDF